MNTTYQPGDRITNKVTGKSGTVKEQPESRKGDDDSDYVYLDIDDDSYSVANWHVSKIERQPIEHGCHARRMQHGVDDITGRVISIGQYWSTVEFPQYSVPQRLRTDKLVRVAVGIDHVIGKDYSSAFFIVADGSPIGTVEAWEPTGALRFNTETNRPQQQWRERSKGDTEWRAIPEYTPKRSVKPAKGATVKHDGLYWCVINVTDHGDNGVELLCNSAETTFKVVNIDDIEQSTPAQTVKHASGSIDGFVGIPDVDYEILIKQNGHLVYAASDVRFK